MLFITISNGNRSGIHLRFSSILYSWFGMYAEIIAIWKIIKISVFIFIFRYLFILIYIFLKYFCVFVVNDVLDYFRFIYHLRSELILNWSALVWCWHKLWSTLKANNCFWGWCFSWTDGKSGLIVFKTSQFNRK